MWTDAATFLYIESYKDNYYIEGLVFNLPHACRSTCAVILRFLGYFWQFWVNDLDLSNGEFKVIWKLHSVVAKMYLLSIFSSLQQIHIRDRP